MKKNLIFSERSHGIRGSRASAIKICSTCFYSFGLCVCMAWRTEKSAYTVNGLKNENNIIADHRVQ